MASKLEEGEVAEHAMVENAIGFYEISSLLNDRPTLALQKIKEEPEENLENNTMQSSDNAYCKNGTNIDNIGLHKIKTENEDTCEGLQPIKLEEESDADAVLESNSVVDPVRTEFEDGEISSLLNDMPTLALQKIKEEPEEHLGNNTMQSNDNAYSKNVTNIDNIKTETEDICQQPIKSEEGSDVDADVESNSIVDPVKTECEDGEICEEKSESPSVSENNDKEEVCLPRKFQVNRAVIESVSKEKQALELQDLQGLSVYDQATLEEGILRQVDEALDEELEAPGHSDTVALLDPEEVETDMERRIRLGEMTPFGTTLNMETTPTPARKLKSGLSEIEKYLQKQAELQGKKSVSNRKRTVEKQLRESKIENSFSCPNGKNIKHNIAKKKKKTRRKECLGTETEDFVPWTQRPNAVPGEMATMDIDNASGSEYVPSGSEYEPSTGDEKEVRQCEEPKKRLPVGRKRKFNKEKPYKLPEDWASDDSDWEYSDEEGNIKKNKRSKKELDDGDVDAFNRRIRQWEREKQKNGSDEETQEYHNFDGGYKLPLDMWNKLYNYQRVGVRWMWELDRQRCGGVLGDEMGLGKTIQVIAFLAGLHVSKLKDKDTSYRGLGPTLIVCPTTVMHQWVREFHQWFPPIRVAVLHESGTFCGKQRSRLISNMVQSGGILITSYTGATQHKDDIITRRWHYVILDEGHKIRNPDAQVTLVVKQLRTSHRIILSGSPMQNNLKELWSLFDFVFPGKLGTLPVFLEQFAVPITQGGYANASQVQVMTAFKCATVLKDTIAPFLLRRMKADVKSHINLPEKNEQVLFCRLTDEQRDYYKYYVESGEVSRILEGRLKIFMGLITLRKICNHPDLYSGGPKMLPGDTEENISEEQKYGHWSRSGKMIVVETLLKLWKRQGHRVLVFTQSRQMLSIMEMFVRRAGYSYLKLDGSTSISARQPLINKFNQDPSYYVMLLTTRVGGLGVNLTGANRVLIYDPDWNPATDTQARERAWRIGQKQSVTVYRLITAGTIEEKMYHRQIFKQFLCNKVLKDPRQRRFFKSNDLYELFTLKETDIEGSTETAAIFAGTGSEVKLDPTKTYKHRKIDPRLSAEPPPQTFSRKKVEKKKLEEKCIKKKQDEVLFSNEKIERMKKLAQMLSQKVVKNVSPEKPQIAEESKTHMHICDKEQEKFEENVPDYRLDVSIPSTSFGDTPIKICDKTPNTTKKRKTISDNEITISEEECSQTKLDISSPSTSGTGLSPSLIGTGKPHKHKSKHRDKKKKKHRDAKFEGETVPHLVKTGSATSAAEENDPGDGKNYATQDEYVLQKLFAKSGLQTALKHDTIMEGGPADYALVEGEADRVAKQAVEKLKESQQECWRPTSGVPTFTGVNGARNFQPKKRFGSGKSSVGSMSSSQLLEQIRKRNGTVDAKDTELSLVEDIRQYVSSHGGTVNTNQLISRFEGRLAEGSSPLFKSLLSKICTFYRAPDKLGYWTLKEEFNW